VVRAPSMQVLRPAARTATELRGRPGAPLPSRNYLVQVPQPELVNPASVGSIVTTVESMSLAMIPSMPPEKSESRAQ
jgi:hypothetical protein